MFIARVYVYFILFLYLKPVVFHLILREFEAGTYWQDAYEICGSQNGTLASVNDTDDARFCNITLNNTWSKYWSPGKRCPLITELQNGSYLTTDVDCNTTFPFVCKIDGIIPEDEDCVIPIETTISSDTYNIAYTTEESSHSSTVRPESTSLMVQNYTGSTTSNSSTVTTPSTLSTTSTLSIPSSSGYIAGGVLGGIGVLLVLIVTICFIRRRRMEENSRRKTRYSAQTPFNNALTIASSSVGIEMQPVDDRIKLPQELAKPRESLFPDFSNILRRSTKSSKSVKSSKFSFAKPKAKDKAAAPEYMNRPSRLVSLMHSLLRRQPRSFHKNPSHEENRKIGRRSKSLTDLNTEGQEEWGINSSIELHSETSGPEDDTNRRDDKNTTSLGFELSKSYHDSGINCDITIE